MKLLILGGTHFLGRALVDAAQAREHEITLFHRGRTSPEAFPDVEHVHGDREHGLAPLAGRAWDAVIDTSGYLPSVVGRNARALADAVGHYTFVSTVSVYADHSVPGGDESRPVAQMPEDAREELTGPTYGPMKALSERAVDEAFPGRALHVRPGLIVGPHDPTDRFTWWARRIARGGEVLAPGNPDAAVQFIDVRDLAEWMIRLSEARHTGVLHVTGPAQPLTLGKTLEAMRQVTDSDARLTWVDESFLLEHGVTPFSDMPLWVPAGADGFLAIDISRALATGLTFRPLPDTIIATLKWDRSTPADARPKKAGLSISAGITPEREQELLASWHARTAAAR
jgi:2'-hydroxyisoflavone reductase